MGIKGGKNGNNMGFGNLCNLRPVIPTTTAESEENTNQIPNTTIIRISVPLYHKFVDFSHRFYNVESYETILSDLLDCYSKYHEPDYSHIHSNK